VAKKPKTLDLEKASDVELEGGNTFLLPMCMARPEIMLGEETTIVLLETVDGAQVGIPLGHNSVEQLHVLLTEALRRLKPGDEAQLH
jgi:hypothetical protein